MTTYATAAGQADPPDWLRDEVEAAVGRRWRSWRRPDTGLSPAHRFIVELDDGERLFVKAATTEQTAVWLRNEHTAIAAAPVRLAPATVAWLEPSDRLPILVTQSLEGYWPASHRGVTWREHDLERVIDALKTLSGLPGPSSLPAAGADRSQTWEAIAANPAPLLALELCSPAWFERAAPLLTEAEQRLDRSGPWFVHGDIRSDNICLLQTGPCFVDWSNARRGAALTDLAEFLPTAHLEGGPAPQALAPDAADWAAALSGGYASRAIAEEAAPAWLRRVFLRLTAIGLDWAAASLGLPERDGRDWRLI